MGVGNLYCHYNLNTFLICLFHVFLKATCAVQLLYKGNLQNSACGTMHPYKLKHANLTSPFIEEATQKEQSKGRCSASNKNKTFHHKAFCATHRFLSQLFNLYASVWHHSFLKRVHLVTFCRQEMEDQPWIQLKPAFTQFWPQSQYGMVWLVFW